MVYMNLTSEVYARMGRSSILNSVTYTLCNVLHEDKNYVKYANLRKLASHVLPS